MDFEQLINNITPDIHVALKRAIEIGKWPDGRFLTQEQKELCMEAVITYEKKFVDETDRVGFIDRGSKADGEMCGDDSSNVSSNDNSRGDGSSSDGSSDKESPLKWQ